jgi:uncharacterized membrane protein YuzA (DUF378 family)
VVKNLKINMMCKHCKKGGWGLVSHVLVIIGGLNWGLVGVGMVAGGVNLNVVNLLLGRFPVLEAVVYLLVGVAAVTLSFGCRGMKCAGCSGCGECAMPGMGK